MLKKVTSKYLLIIFLLVLTLLGGCSNSHTENTENTEKTWFHEDEFAQDSTIHAKIHNTVILDISSEQQPDGIEDHAIRYEYDESGEHVFCIDPNEKYIRDMTLLDEGENVKLTLKKEDGCAHLYLEDGKYTMKITHDTSKVPKRGTVAFIHHPAKEVQSDANVADDSNPPYYAFQVTGGSYDGYYLGTKKEEALNIMSDFLGVIPTSDHTSFGQMRHLFNVEGKDGKQILEGYNWSSYFFPQECYSWPFFCVQSQDSSLTAGNTVFTSLAIAQVDLYLQLEAEQTYTLWNDAFVIMGPSSLYAAENSLLYSTSTTKEMTDPTLFVKNLNMRLYKDGSQYSLQDGEVAFSEECNLEGPTYVISGDIPDSIIVTLSYIKSIKLGGNYTTLSIFEENNFINLKKIIGMDADCLDDPINFATIGSLKPFNAKKVFLSSHNCDYCNLTGADLSNLDLDNVSLQYANLTKIQLNNSALERANMSYALLYGANLDYADLNGSTMCEAFLNGNTISNHIAASLTGAHMKNVNLAGAQLSGATFVGTNFYSDFANGCAPLDCGFTKECASAYKATLDGANFNNAYLNGVDFSNSDIRGVTFSNAVLTGAHFNGSNLNRDPNSGSPTDFNGAFIGGADFTNTTIEGANFASAYIDFNDTGNCMYFQLDAAHTSFANWSDPGIPVCTILAYSTQTITPVTDQTNICPDGSNGSCSRSSWTGPLIPMKNSTQKASFCTDTSLVCSPPNFKW